MKGSSHVGRRWTLIATLVVVVVAALVWALLARREEPLLRWEAQGADRLVTNEYATYNPGAADAVRDDVWEMGSGSLFVRDGVGWSGAPTVGAVDARSAAGTNSGVFRMVSRRADFGDIALSARLRIVGMTAGDEADQPRSDWDGVHLWVRHVSEEEVYIASVARRDGSVAIKRKLPGGPSNGGTYTTLAQTSHPFPLEEWHDVEARVRAVEGGQRIALIVDGEEILHVVDSGQVTEGQTVEGRPVSEPGAVGVRADNTELELQDVEVRACVEDDPDACR